MTASLPLSAVSTTISESLKRHDATTRFMGSSSTTSVLIPENTGLSVFSGLSAFPADETMRQQAVQAVRETAPEINVFEGRVCSGDQFISTREQKDTIISNFGGLCCEMEGAAIAQVCYLNHTPFVVIRAISDKEDGSQSVEYEEFEAKAAAECADIVRYMVKGL